VSFADFLLKTDDTGVFHEIAAEQHADEAAGIVWGLFDGDRLIGTHTARYLAEFDRADAADAMDRPVSSFTVRPVAVEQGSVAA
jgi:hypothetical protein